MRKQEITQEKEVKQENISEVYRCIQDGDYRKLSDILLEELRIAQECDYDV